MIESHQETDLLKEDAAYGDVQDFKTYELDRLLAEQLDQAFHKKTSQVCLENLAKIASEHSPIDLAYAVTKLPSTLRPILFENFSTVENKIKFIMNTDSATRLAIFRHISDQETKKILENARTDEVVDMLSDMSEKRYRRMLELLDQKTVSEIKELREHRRNSAGRLMISEYFSFSGEVTVGQVCEIIRENPGIEFTSRIFVLDEEGKLLGYVPARHLIVNDLFTKLQDVMRPCTYQVYPETSREEVIELVERYKISGLPVVDLDNTLLGLITYDDVIEAIEDITDETIASMVGTSEKVSEPEPLFRKFFYRAPWLIVTLLAGFLNMSVMNIFQSYEGSILTFVFFFVPLVTGMSGNIGLQCSTILVRNMALGLVNKDSRKQIMFKEILLGLFTGCVFGVLAGIFVYCLNFQGITMLPAAPITVGLIVGIGLIGGCFSGTFLGVFSPIIFSRIGVDPAVSSGPIVTAFNDFLSMTIYFLIAIGLSRFLSF